jgi:hypothetical protein
MSDRTWDRAALWGIWFGIAAMLGCVGLVLTSGVAGATVPDPTDGGAAAFGTNVTGWIVGYGVPMLVGVMAVGLAVLLLIKYGKRAVGGAAGEYAPADGAIGSTPWDDD